MAGSSPLVGTGTPDAEILDLAAWARYLSAFDVHAEHVYRLALLLVGSRLDAEDLTRELFLEAHAPWRDGRVDDLAHHLRRRLVARVVADDHRPLPGRFIWRWAHVESADDGHDSIDSDLQGALDRLDPTSRAALVLRYYEGLTAAETATVLGTDAPTVAVLVTNAFELLGPELEVAR